MFLWDGEKQRIELVSPGRAVATDNTEQTTQSLNLPLSGAEVEKEFTDHKSNDDGNNEEEEEVFTKRLAPSGDATSSEASPLGLDRDADAIGAAFGWASPQVAPNGGTHEEVNQSAVSTSVAQPGPVASEGESEEVNTKETQAGQDGASTAYNDSPNDNLQEGANCEGSECVGLSAMDGATLAALSEDSTWDAPFPSSSASSKNSPKRGGSATTKIGLSGGGRVEIKVCDRYMAEFAEAEDAVGMHSLLPWLLYGDEHTTNNTTMQSSSVASSTYERLFGVQTGACEEDPIIMGSGESLSGPLSSLGNLPTSGLVSTALQTSSRVFERLKVEKNNLLAAFESQLDAAVSETFIRLSSDSSDTRTKRKCMYVHGTSRSNNFAKSHSFPLISPIGVFTCMQVIQPDFAASETDTGSWKQHGGKKKGRDTSGQWQLKKAAAAAAGTTTNSFSGASSNSGFGSGSALSNTASASTGASAAKQVSSPTSSSSGSSKWAQAHADASTAISAAVQTSKVAKLVEWPEAELKSLKQSAAQVTLPSLWREVRKVRHGNPRLLFL